VSESELEETGTGQAAKRIGQALLANVSTGPSPTASITACTSRAWSCGVCTACPSLRSRGASQWLGGAAPLLTAASTPVAVVNCLVAGDELRLLDVVREHHERPRRRRDV
jgi:hypothetical protein